MAYHAHRTIEICNFAGNYYLAVSLKHHGNATLQFEQQYQNTKDFIISFIEAYKPLKVGSYVMDIGCGEGGVLKAFAEKGCHGLGVDLSPHRIQNAIELQKENVQKGIVQFIAKNIYDFSPEYEQQFDLIIFKDSIEHIPEQAKIIGHCKRFLKGDGMIFFGFPAWRMPFGGHQQILESKFWSHLPYYHLLPMPLYKFCLKFATQDPDAIQELIEIKTLGLSTTRFERIVREQGYRIVARQLWLINPIYAYKFGLKPRKQFKWLEKLGSFRDFFTTTAFYLIAPQS